MWKWGGSAPCGQARLWRTNGPQYAKSHAIWQSPSSRTEELRTCSKKIFFDPFLGPLFAVCAVGHIPCLAYYLAVPAAPGRLNAAWVLTKPLILKNWPIYARYGHIPGTGGQIQKCSPGRLQGHLWVIPTIGSCFYRPLVVIPCLCFRCAASHPVQGTPKHRLLTQNTTF